MQGSEKFFRPAIRANAIFDPVLGVTFVPQTICSAKISVQEPAITIEHHALDTNIGKQLY
jgi:hypothetical protein